MNKKYDTLIFAALKDTKAYNWYFNKLNHFLLIFNTKKRGLHCSREIMLGTELTHTHTKYNFIQNYYITNIHHEIQKIDSFLLISNTHRRFS